MPLNANQSAANYMQAEWKSAHMADKIKIIQKAQRLGVTFAASYTATEELEEMMRIFVDRELKVSFLKGFESAITASMPALEETKNYVHYELLRNKRVA